MVGSFQLDAAVSKQPGKDTVGNSCANLRFYIITNNRGPPFGKALLPVTLSGDKNRDTIDKATASRQHLLDIPFRRLFTAHRQIVNDHIGLGFLKDFNYIRRWSWRLLYYLG
ncbi:hypothetical protein ES703_52563 [subsurface metagenome]